MIDEVLNQSVSTIAGIGPQKKEDLRAFGIETVRDLLEYFPFRYEDVSIKDITQMKDGEKVTIKGVVYSEPSVQWLPRKKSRLSVKVMVEPLLITATWFNRHFLKEQLLPGKEVILTGKWEQRRLQMTVSHSEFADQRNQGEGTLQPVYSVGGPLTVYHLKKMIKQALIQYGNVIEDALPRKLLDKYRLVTRKQAINQLHFPSNDKDLKQARRRMAYEELFMFQLKLHAFRQQSRTREKGISHTFSIDKLQQFLHLLPFTLTKAQLKVLEEIKKDMESPYSMNRLLQGDVGSGKTVIAAISIYATYLSGYQSALMVPTEILAQQHTVELNRLLCATDLNIGTITGNTSEKERKSIYAGLEDGSVDVIVGTHALIQERVIFDKVGLVITDEQHRFGVSQRATLRLKGMHPDVLLMTATPIPRTLAITAYGDMDVSTIDELPAGRKAIETYWVKHDVFDRVISFIEKQIQLGHQVYIICPLIEESEKLDVQNVIDLHQQLTTALPTVKVGLMHGRLPGHEKEESMQQFSQGKVDVLVSTTVVEVGVNVPNASLMVVYDADRFGLAQLHQLRGRVGRSDIQSHCILVADPKSDVGKERMRVMTETNDGFEIARRDLELRGPGDLFGWKQSGIPEFKIADLIHDYRILEVAREDAKQLVESDSFWNEDRYLPLRQYLRQQGVLDGSSTLD